MGWDPRIENPSYNITLESYKMVKIAATRSKIHQNSFMGLFGELTTLL